jgi:hypothetical protein
MWVCTGAVVGRAVGRILSLRTLARALIAGGVTLGVFRVLDGMGMGWFVNLCLGSPGYLGLLLGLQAVPRDVLMALLFTNSLNATKG